MRRAVRNKKGRRQRKRDRYRPNPLRRPLLHRVPNGDDCDELPLRGRPASIGCRRISDELGSCKLLGGVAAEPKHSPRRLFAPASFRLGDMECPQAAGSPAAQGIEDSQAPATTYRAQTLPELDFCDLVKSTKCEGVTWACQISYFTMRGAPSRFSL